MREFEPEDTGFIFLQDGEVGLFVVEDVPTFRIVGGVDELAGFVFAEVKAALVADLGEEGADVFVSECKLFDLGMTTFFSVFLSQVAAS